MASIEAVRAGLHDDGSMRPSTSGRTSLQQMNTAGFEGAFSHGHWEQSAALKEASIAKEL